MNSREPVLLQPASKARRGLLGLIIAGVAVLMFIDGVIFVFGVGGLAYLMNGPIQSDQARKVRADLREIEIGFVRYQIYFSLRPTQKQGLEALVDVPTVPPVPKNYHPVLKRAALLDPWGHKYQYRYPGVHNPNGYDIFSMGADGTEGTQDDIGNW